MKKILLSLTFGAFSILAIGQVSMTLEGQSTLISGQTLTYSNTTGNEEVIDVIVHNNSDNSLDLKVSRKKIQVPSNGWSDFLCWGAEGDPFGGTCYSASQVNSTNWYSDPLTVVSEGVGVIAIHINPDDMISASGHYRYYVGDDSNLKMDSVDFLITTSTLTIKESKQNTTAIYPNPADNYLTVSIPNGSEGSVKLTDVLGKVIYDERLISTKKLDVSSFKNGVYVALINVNGTSYTKRFVVKH
jgi:hypothetical protein